MSQVPTAVCTYCSSTTMFHIPFPCTNVNPAAMMFLLHQSAKLEGTLGDVCRLRRGSLATSLHASGQTDCVRRMCQGSRGSVAECTSPGERTNHPPFLFLSLAPYDLTLLLAIFTKPPGDDLVTLTTACTRSSAGPENRVIPTKLVWCTLLEFVGSSL